MKQTLLNKMIRTYSYRWPLAFMISLSIVVIGYYDQIKPMLNQLNQLQVFARDTEHSMIHLKDKTGEEVMDDKKMNHPFVTHMAQTDFLKSIFSLVNINGLSLFFLDKQD